MKNKFIRFIDKYNVEILININNLYYCSLVKEDEIYSLDYYHRSGISCDIFLNKEEAIKKFNKVIKSCDGFEVFCKENEIIKSFVKINNCSEIVLCEAHECKYIIYYYDSILNGKISISESLETKEATIEKFESLKKELCFNGLHAI